MFVVFHNQSPLISVDKQTEINISEFLTFVWLLSLKLWKTTKLRKNCKLVTLTSFASATLLRGKRKEEATEPTDSCYPIVFASSFSIFLLKRPYYYEEKALKTLTKQVNDSTSVIFLLQVNFSSVLISD